MNTEASPRPWCVEGDQIVDANGFAVTPIDGGARVSDADAALIVDAVNEYDRLRDIVRTFADVTHSLIANYEHRYRDDTNSMAFVANVRELVREARAAIGEEKP